MSAEVTLTPMKQEKVWNRPPISLDFQVRSLISSVLEIITYQFIIIGANVYRKRLESKVFENSG